MEPPQCTTPRQESGAQQGPHPVGARECPSAHPQRCRSFAEQATRSRASGPRFITSYCPGARPYCMPTRLQWIRVERKRTMTVIGSRLVRMAILLAAASCATNVAPRDPFAGVTSSAATGRQAYRVRLEVVCDQCLIRYEVDAQSFHARPASDDQVWSTSFLRYPVASETIRLIASVPPSGRPLSSVRIFVNGEVVASARAGSDPADLSPSLAAETVIPPRQSEPDRRSASVLGLRRPAF